jgi:hypothetical protein
MLKIDIETQQQGWGYSSVVKCFPSMHKALDSLPSTAKTNQPTKPNQTKNTAIGVLVIFKIFLVSFELKCH